MWYICPLDYALQCGGHMWHLNCVVLKWDIQCSRYTQGIKDIELKKWDTVVQ